MSTLVRHAAPSKTTRRPPPSVTIQPVARACTGCNIGYFAMHAAMLGASVRCYEPTPFFTMAIRESLRLAPSEVAGRVVVENVAVVPSAERAPPSLNFSYAYSACHIGRRAIRQHVARYGHWTTPTLAMSKLVVSKSPITLLKVDIDHNEGELLHHVIDLLASGEAHIDTILVELGDNRASRAGCAPSHATCKQASTLRGGSLRDVWRLQHELNYTAYRVNIHTAREIFGWRGDNLNLNHMAPAHPGLKPLFGVRMMRKLELLKRSLPLEQYATGELFAWGQSFLFTRQQLLERARHHSIDVAFVGLIASREPLNAGMEEAVLPRADVEVQA